MHRSMCMRIVIADVRLPNRLCRLTNRLNPNIAVCYPAISPDSRNSMSVRVGTLWYSLVHRQWSVRWLRRPLRWLRSPPFSLVIVIRSRIADRCQFSREFVGALCRIRDVDAMCCRDGRPMAAHSWNQRRTTDNLYRALALDGNDGKR